jgi:hypothetical protein
MGEFLAMLAVRNDEVATDELRARVVTNLRANRSVRGMVEVDGASPGAQRMIVATPTGPWVFVHDDPKASRTIAEWSELALHLTTTTNSVVVAIQIDDGDVLDLLLLEHGEIIDHYCNWPGYHEGKQPPARARRDRWRGDPAAWAELLPEMGIDAIAAVFAVDGGRPMVRLTALASALGWNPEVWMGADAPARPEELRTILAWQPAATPSGPPRLQHEAGPETSILRCGETVDLVVSAHNVGGPIDGLDIVVFGPAVVLGYVQPMSIAVSVGVPGTTSPLVVPLVPAEETYACHVGVVIPGGHANVAEAHRVMGTASGAVAAWMAARVQIELTATAQAVGRASLHVGLVPDANPDEGQTSWTIDIEVSP